MSGRSGHRFEGPRAQGPAGRWQATLCFLLLIAGAGSLLAATDALAFPPWQRAGVLALPAGECQELRVERVGTGILELRFFSEPLPLPVGPDLKTTGAALLLAAEDPERASFLLYHESGIYQQSARLSEPIRWMRRGTELCVASGSRPVFCGRTRGEVRGTVRIAFGGGWETRISGCAAFPLRVRPSGAWVASLALFLVLASLALWSSRRPRDVVAIVVLAGAFACGGATVMDPWLLPSAALLPAGVIASSLLAGWALFERRRSWSQRIPRVALGLFVAFALALVPHPVWTQRSGEPAVPSLWLDTANWHPRSPHQSLDFRGRPLAGVVFGAENWLVLGGSVTFGEGVEASQTFTAVAQDLLRAHGDRRVLLNAGMQGWNIHNIDRFLADLGDSLPVTGIVLVSILNNATLPIATPSVEGCERSLLRAYLCNAWRSQLLVAWPKVFLPKPRNPERYRRTLRSLLVRELALGRRVVLLDETSEIDSGLLRLWDTESYRAIARELSQELGVRFHPVTDLLAALPPSERYLDGIHPTVAMHALLGHRLYEIVRER